MCTYARLGGLLLINLSMSFLVDLFLDEISECFGKDAVLLTLTPKTIGGKNVKDLFTEYVPRKSRFVKCYLSIFVRDLALLCSTAIITIV